MTPAPEDSGRMVDTLFLRPDFAAFQAAAQDKRLVTFGRGEASLTLAGKDGAWSNPVTGAFGGVAAHGRAPAAEVCGLVEAMTGWLKVEPVPATGRVRLPPDGFPDPNAAALENALFQQGWALEHVDINHHIEVVPPDAFLGGLGETKRKEYRRLLRSGARFETAAPEQAEAVYDTIAANRAARGYPMTMAWPQVQALASAFPDRVGFHAVVRDGDILAGAVRLEVTRAHQYVFYWGESPAARRESPVTLLAHGLVAWCAERGARTLDLGTSTDGSTPNSGLIAFKEGLGAVATAKRTFVLRGSAPGAAATP